MAGTRFAKYSARNGRIRGELIVHLSFLKWVFLLLDLEECEKIGDREANLDVHVENPDPVTTEETRTDTKWDTCASYLNVLKTQCVK